VLTGVASTRGRPIRVFFARRVDFIDILALDSRGLPGCWQHPDSPDANHGSSMASGADISAALRSLVKYLGALLTAGDHKVTGDFGVPVFSQGRS
jgi:hypothetical protein